MLPKSPETRAGANTENSRGPIILAVATRPELRACAASEIDSTNNNHILLLQTGVGLSDIETLENRIIESGAAGLVSIGTAGGLAPGLNSGTLLLPERIRRVDGQTYQTRSGWRHRILAAVKNDLRVETGDLLCVPRVIRHPDEKRSLHVQTQAVGADMESADLAEIAARNCMPFLTVRAIADTAGDEIPEAAMASLTSAGNLDLPALLAFLLRHPSDLLRLMTTRRQFRAASDTLNRACRLAGKQLSIAVG